MLKLEENLNVAPEPELTIWLGDPAVDPETSNVARWAETADPSALVVKDGQKAAAIRWRALDEDELSIVQATNFGSGGLRLQAAATFGLVSIHDVELERFTYPVVGVQYVSPRQRRKLQALKARFRLTGALNALQIAETGKPFEEDIEDEVGLMEWLGLIVLARTFRDRAERKKRR